MTMDILTFLGLWLTMGGAVLLAYGVLNGPVHWYREDRHSGHVEAIENIRASVRVDYRKLEEAGIPNGEQAKLAERNSDAQRKREEDGYRQGELAERRKAAWLAVVGLGLVFGGTAMQAVPPGYKILSDLANFRTKSEESTLRTASYDCQKADAAP